MGIILCKELGKQYEEETFEYLKLSDILVSYPDKYKLNIDFVYKIIPIIKSTTTLFTYHSTVLAITSEILC